MNNIYCTGVTPFLNLCASNILPKNTPIIYLSNLSKNLMEKKFESKDLNKKKEYVKSIAFFFNRKVIFKKFFTIKIKDNDLVTSNLLKYLYPYLKGQELILFPEGSSCLNNLIKKDYKFILIRFLKNYLKKFFIGHYKIKTRWILPDRDFKVKNLIGKKSTDKLIYYKPFFSNINKCSKYIIKKYPELNLCDDKKIIFHPINPYLNKFSYKKWIENYYELIGTKKLLLKAHENDYRDYRKVFEKFNYILIPKKFTTLPAELIIDNFSCKYVGYYSSIMLHFKKNDINFIIPNDEKITRLSDKEFIGLKKLMCI